MTSLNVLTLATDDACGFYRVKEPARVLAAHGFPTTAAKVTEVGVSGRPHASVQVAIPEGTEVAVVQRPLHRDMLALIEGLQREGCAVVVEVDDAFDVIPNHRPAWRDYHPHWHPIYNKAGELVAGRFDPSVEQARSWRNVARACELADLVVVPTPALAQRYGRHGRVAILPNLVPAAWLGIAEERDPGRLRVGWSGNLSVHAGDPVEVAGVLQGVLDEHGAELVVVGEGRGIAAELRLREEPRASGWVPLGQYPRYLSLVDVGIVPLAPNLFNEGKSWLTGLIMAAVGVPFVASATGPYRELAGLGAGLVADRPKQWRRHLRTLLGSEAARMELAEAGRRVAKTLTYEQHADRWLAAWHRAADNAVRRLAA
jgi:glycosyltransferase involved in cell wall biosynthesis